LYLIGRNDLSRHFGSLNVIRHECLRCLFGKDHGRQLPFAQFLASFQHHDILQILKFNIAALYSLILDFNLQSLLKLYSFLPDLTRFVEALIADKLSTTETDTCGSSG
jgi:hypothetical protein